jgi:hypothetical protein
LDNSISLQRAFQISSIGFSLIVARTADVVGSYGRHFILGVAGALVPFGVAAP